MTKCYIVTNPKDVVNLGVCGLIPKFRDGKYQVKSDIAKFLYYPCYGVVEGGASYADVTAAFNYMGFPDKESSDGIARFVPERLIKFFDIEDEIGDTVFIRFNSNYEELY